MLRIIAGSAGGLHLLSPPSGLRPTMDRVRAAVFSSLGDRVPGARCLDLFAGTGAMGLEALSRGAVSCLFVEQKRANATCIERNLERTKLADHQNTRVLQIDAMAYVERRAPEGAFDLIFADPPYFMQNDQLVDFPKMLLASDRLRQALSPDGMFVLEKNPLAPCEIPPVWELRKSKRYGITEMNYLVPAERNHQEIEGHQES
jgi:16S rRNA (guanine966-N2)-methyltransferase